MKLRIGTLNCQNNEENRDLRNDNALILSNHINDIKYDILGTQELTIKFTNKVKSFLDDYKVYGKYQYGSGIIGTKIPLLKDYNQGNQIITKCMCKKTKTYTMPWIPKTFKDFVKAWKKKSMTKRMVTITELEVNDSTIFVLNAHLDYYIPNVQQRQLNYIYKKITNYLTKGNVILMGDFNLDLEEDMFNDFISRLDSIGIKRVPMNKKTNSDRHYEESAIDHIFIPNSWKIIDYGYIDGLDNITDHKAVYVDVEI